MLFKQDKPQIVITCVKCYHVTVIEPNAVAFMGDEGNEIVGDMAEAYSTDMFDINPPPEGYINRPPDNPNLN